MSAPPKGLRVHRIDAAAMAERAVALVAERLADGADPVDVAVLARVNSALLPVQVALSEAGLAHTAPLDATVLGRTGIRTALAYLRLGLDPEQMRREDLLDTINRPARKVKSAVQPLLGRRNQFSMAQLEQITDSLGETHRDRFRDYLGDLRGLAAAITDEADTARCLWLVRNRIGLGEAMDALDASRSRPEGSSHGDDLDALEQLAALQPDPAAFRDWLVERLRVPADPHGVTLSTVHRVKGMEWPHVLVFAANQGLFPHRLADDVEEERRVFHVAITRCQEQVDVIADRQRCSPFVAELTAPSPERHPAPAPAQAPVADVVAQDGTAVARPGLALTVVGGFSGTVTAVEPGHVAVTLSGAAAGVVVRVPFGQLVSVGADAVTLVAAPARRDGRSGVGSGRADAGRSGRLEGLADDVPIDDALYESLRSWRARIAAESGLPAYLIFHDRHLQLIAGRKPGTLRELAGCPGVGPTKLERYGDDLLDVVAAHPD